MVALVLGLFSTAVGLIFLIGCFTRVDSPAFIERAEGNEEKIARLRSLQEAWTTLGKPRQFIASSSAYLIMGAGLLLLRYSPTFAEYWWVVPVLLAINALCVLHVKRFADSTLDERLPGHAEVLTVIRRQIRMCVTFCVVFSVLVLGPNFSLNQTPARDTV